MAIQPPLTPEVILLDLWNDNSISVSSKNLISLLFMASKCILAKKKNGNQ